MIAMAHIHCAWMLGMAKIRKAQKSEQKVAYSTVLTVDKNPYNAGHTCVLVQIEFCHVVVRKGGNYYFSEECVFKGQTAYMVT